jgi:hypothetical protein
MTVPNVVGGDLYHLWRVSDVHLPRVADVFFDATRTLNGGRSAGGQSDTDAFRVDTNLGGQAMSSSVAAAWEDVRDEMQRGLAQVGETVMAAAEAVRAAIDAYQQADTRNADLLRQYLADPNHHDPDNPPSNPPAAWADDYPGEPVLPAADGGTP